MESGGGRYLRIVKCKHWTRLRYRIDRNRWERIARDLGRDWWKSERYRLLCRGAVMSAHGLLFGPVALRLEEISQKLTL